MKNSPVLYHEFAPMISRVNTVLGGLVKFSTDDIFTLMRNCRGFVGLIC